MVAQLFKAKARFRNFMNQEKFVQKFPNGTWYNYIEETQWSTAIFKR